MADPTLTKDELLRLIRDHGVPSHVYSFGLPAGIAAHDCFSVAPGPRLGTWELCYWERGLSSVRDTVNSEERAFYLLWRNLQSWPR